VGTGHCAQGTGHLALERVCNTDWRCIGHWEGCVEGCVKQPEVALGRGLGRGVWGSLGSHWAVHSEKGCVGPAACELPPWRAQGEASSALAPPPRQHPLQPPRQRPRQHRHASAPSMSGGGAPPSPGGAPRLPGPHRGPPSREALPGPPAPMTSASPRLTSAGSPLTSSTPGRQQEGAP